MSLRDLSCCLPFKIFCHSSHCLGVCLLSKDTFEPPVWVSHTLDSWKSLDRESHSATHALIPKRMTRQAVYSVSVWSVSLLKMILCWCRWSQEGLEMSGSKLQFGLPLHSHFMLYPLSFSSWNCFIWDFIQFSLKFECQSHSENSLWLYSTSDKELKEEGCWLSKRRDFQERRTRNCPKSEGIAETMHCSMSSFVSPSMFPSRKWIYSRLIICD